MQLPEVTESTETTEPTAEQKQKAVEEFIKKNARIVPINAETFRYCSRRVRRKFERAYMKMHGVPKPVHQTVLESSVFKRLNRTTMKEMMKALPEETPRMNLLGEVIP